jgi:hypothetical protein
MATEKRLIDANALMRYTMNQKSRTVDCNDIARFPTVDAAEVVHGRCNWCNGDYHTKIMATAIRYHSNGNMDGYELKVNYCPNCGADMRDGGKDDVL